MKKSDSDTLNKAMLECSSNSGDKVLIQQKSAKNIDQPLIFKNKQNN